MKEQLALLIELQKAESEISKMNIKCRMLPEEIAELDETLKEFHLSVEENRKNLQGIQQDHREKEEQLKRGQEVLKRTRDRLSEVKTNKEYQAVLKEIEGIEKKNSVAEDEIISLLEKTDHLKEVLRIKEKEVVSYERQYWEGKNKLEEEIRAIDQNLLACKKKGNELKKRISAHLLKKYEAIKLLNNGLAVAPVWKEVCEGCHMKIPAQLYNEVQKFIELCICPNCNRIIYWQDHSEDET